MHLFTKSSKGEESWLYHKNPVRTLIDLENIKNADRKEARYQERAK